MDITLNWVLDNNGLLNFIYLRKSESGMPEEILGNLRTTTKFTTTTFVDWENTGTRTSVSAGKRIRKMQSASRSTTTALNVNTNVKL